MRLTELTFNDPEVKKLARAVATVFVNVSKDNMKIFELTGDTHPTPDTKLLFRHGIGSVPAFWYFQEGRVYVPRFGISENEIDVRSAEVSEPFRMLIVA